MEPVYRLIFLVFALRSFPPLVETKSPKSKSTKVTKSPRSTYKDLTSHSSRHWQRTTKIITGNQKNPIKTTTTLCLRTGLENPPRKNPSTFMRGSLPESKPPTPNHLFTISWRKKKTPPKKKSTSRWWPSRDHLKNHYLEVTFTTGWWLSHPSEKYEWNWKSSN